MAFGHQPMPTATLSGSAIFLSCGACIWQSLWLEHSMRDCLCFLWFAARERERREVRATEREPHHLSCFCSHTAVSLVGASTLSRDPNNGFVILALQMQYSGAHCAKHCTCPCFYLCVCCASSETGHGGDTFWLWAVPPYVMLLFVFNGLWLLARPVACFCGLGRSGAEHIKHWHGVGIWWPSLESHWRPPRGVCVAASSPTVSF